MAQSSLASGQHTGHQHQSISTHMSPCLVSSLTTPSMWYIDSPDESCALAKDEPRSSYPAVLSRRVRVTTWPSSAEIHLFGVALGSLTSVLKTWAKAVR